MLPWSRKGAKAPGKTVRIALIAYHEEMRMRRKERAMDRARIDKILAEGIFGVLSLSGGDGYPYGVPMNYVYTEERILLHAALEGEKLDRIRKDNRVSFCVVGKATPLPDKFSTDYASVIVFGRANIIEGDQKLNVLLALVDKYCAQYREQGRELALKTLDKLLCIAIDIERVTGKLRK